MRRRLAILGILGLVTASCAPREPKPIVLIPPAGNETSAPEPVAPPYFDISIKSQGQRIPVIMYHDIIAKRDRNSVFFDCTQEEFEDQMKQLAEWGAVPISLDQLYAHLTKGEPVPENAIVLTFDDNYQGFHDRAWPILKQHGYPAVVFVHTGFVGNKEGLHPKMDWEELRQLAADPLITIGNHTITHPADLTKLDPEAQRREIFDAKAELERQLNKKIDYFAYPEGNNDESTQALVREAGHEMAFTVHNGPAEESPNIVAVDRYIHTKLQNAWDDREKALKGGALGVFRAPLRNAPVRYQELEQEGVKVGLITGGMPVSRMSDTREGVLDFIKRSPGTVAGINGGFFAMAAVAAKDNKMVGPCKTAEMPEVVTDTEKFRWDKLRNRPLVMWNATDFAIVPFEPESMSTPAPFHDFMVDVTDTFLAGVWLVHQGVAREREDMNTFASKDIQDARKRAFMGVMNDGSFVAGASLQSVSSASLAKALAASGVAEAVLLDSGFSTSLVYGQSIKATGHSNKDHPSRPVPHAIVIKGSLDPETAALAAPDPSSASVQDEPSPRRRHRRRRTR